MRLDRGLRSTALKPYPAGYEAPATDDINRDHPNCVIGGISEIGEWIGDDDTPAIIGLNIHVIPLWADNQGATAQLDENIACSIYVPMSVFDKVRIKAIGDGFYQKSSGDERVAFIGNRFLNYQLDIPSPYLYQKDFLTQSQGKTIHHESQLSTTEEVPFLWAYGAHQVGDDIHPILFSLESVRDETFLQTSSLVFWRERGVVPALTDQDQLSRIQDVFELDQTRSLKESIEVGMSVIHLTLGKDESGYLLSVPYISYRLSNNIILYKRRG